MSEYNPIVINCAGRSKRGSLSFLIANLYVSWTLPIHHYSRGIALNVCCSSSLEGNCHNRVSFTKQQLMRTRLILLKIFTQICFDIVLE